jgi:hypothetical protein
VTSAEKFEPFARQVRANIERILAEYEIEDKSTLKEFKGTLLAMELLAGNSDDDNQFQELIPSNRRSNRRKSSR